MSTVAAVGRPRRLTYSAGTIEGVLEELRDAAREVFASQDLLEEAFKKEALFNALHHLNTARLMLQDTRDALPETQSGGAS